MRFIFKTDYAQDLQLFKHGGQTFWYGALAVALVFVPWLLSPYFVSQVTFVLIYSIVALGLMLLSGFTGQISLGHAAFLAVGAYTEGVLAAKGWPFPFSMAAAALTAGIVGVIVGTPALRVKGIYLAIATMAFNIIVEEVLARWESMTGGNTGLQVGPLAMFGWTAQDEREMYYVALVITVLVTLGVVNLLRSPTGRAFVAIRDSEISAASMGINLALYKSMSFVLSAAHHRHRRRALCAQAAHHHARPVHRAAVDRDADDGGDRRPRLDPRRVLRRGVHHRPAATHRGREGLPAAGHRPGDRPAADPVRSDSGRLHPVRAAGPVWPLGEDANVLPALSLLPSRHVPAAEDVHEIGAAAVNPMLAVEGLSIVFGGLRAVSDVSFAVRKGEIYTLIGPNGAGKTTIFNAISRIYEPSSGRIVFEGEDLARHGQDKIAGLGIARTFQNIELFEHATVLQNLLIGRHVHRGTQLWQELVFLPAVRRQELAFREAVEKVIDFFDLAHYRDTRVAGLPYGVRKVVELARALAVEPKLLLLDEPSSGLNVEETDDMAFWIHDIRSDLGITVLMVEHDMALVQRVSDRVLALNHGEVIAEGKPAEVQGHPGVIEAYLGVAVEA